MPLPRHIAPAGTPIAISDLLGAGFDQLLGHDTETALIDAIRSRYGVEHCLVLSSGRAALTLILKALVRLNTDPRRVEVVVPGYTCYSVAAAVVASGLRLRIVDIDPHTLSYNRQLLESVDYSRVLAITSANLYGLPNELDRIEETARRHGAYMIDDAAQSLHAGLHGRHAGTFGDVGIFSFDKGKNITSLQGGAIVTRDAGIAAELRKTVQTLPGESAAATASAFLKLALYALLLRPWLYWIPAGIPALGLGRTVYTTDIPMHRLSRMGAGLAGRLFGAIDAITENRVRVAGRIGAAIAGSTALSPVKPIAGARPVYLRLPCLADTATRRDRLVNDLVQAGIGATASFPRALCDLDEIAAHRTIEADACDGARSVAGRIVTLPTLAYVREHDVLRLVQSLATEPAA